MPGCDNANSLRNLFQILNMDFSTSNIPAVGFNPTTIRQPGRSRRRAQLVCQQLMSSISKLLCPSDPFLILTLLMDKEKEKELAFSKHSRLEAYVLSYALHLCSSISNPAQALLATRYDKQTCNQLLRKAAIAKSGMNDKEIQLLNESDSDFDVANSNLHSDSESSGTIIYQQLRKNKARMGKVKFATLRCGHQKVTNGESFPSASYKYRVGPRKLQSSIQFIGQILPARPGMVRNVRLGTTIFKHLPVYSREGMLIKDLFQQYKSVTEADDQVGMHTFHDSVKLLTQPGECRAGLPTYDVDFRYVICHCLCSAKITRKTSSNAQTM